VEFARLAGEAMLGPVGPFVLAAAVLLSVVGSAMALIMMAPRLYEAMSRDDLFPAAIAARASTTGSPIRATAVLAILATVFVLLGTFEQIVSFFICTTLGFVALAAGAIFVVRRRDGAVATFRAPGYPFTPALFVVLVLVVVAMIAVNRPTQALAGLALVFLGLPAYRFFVRSPRATGV
jgi:APA family basic amino acid/polyamine antiporter